jgi:colanic acid/amylovoran biosynthesis glycosyltransferase
VKVCYLVNQYPKVSHTFIRREILALENLGVEVLRLSARKTQEVLVDPIDKEEAKKTVYLIDGDKLGLLIAFIKCALFKPGAFYSALKLALKLGRNNNARLKNLAYLAEACSTYFHTKNYQVTHLHAHFGTNPAAIALLCKTLGGPEYSFTVHGPDELDDPRGLSLEDKIEKAKFVVAITSFCKSQLSRWTHYENWQKIVEVHCAIDEELLSLPTTPATTNKRLVNIGRLSEQKGQMLLLEAIKILRDQGCDLTLDIIGDGDLRETIELYLRDNNLQSIVTLLGWQSSESIVQTLDNSAAMVLPSFAEGLPVVIMEAYARARPVITTRIAGIPELVDNECGWLITPGSVNEIVEGIKQLLASDTLSIDQLGQKGRRRVIERHSANREAQTLLNFIQA